MMSKKYRNGKKLRLAVTAKNKGNNKTNFIFIFLFIVLYTILFFLIRDKLLFTPDFGESDAYHFNISVKYFLKNALQQGKIPFWTDQLQGGYPLFSEGQIGALYLPNVIFLTFFSFHTGYNLLLISALFIFSLGMYFFLKELKIVPTIAFLVSLNFVFNGIFSLHFVHLNLLQTFSTVPLLFFLYLRFLRTLQKKYIVIFCFIVSQMIFAGYIPIFFIAIFGFAIWSFVFLLMRYKTFSMVVKHSIALFIFLTIGFFIALPQILPTAMLNRYSSRMIQLAYDIATSFPLQFKNLIAFFSPYAFGNPKLGTYAPFSSEWGIFWENTPYAGKIFSILFISSCVLFFFIKNKKYKRFFLFHVSFFILFILLALGKNSPLYFVFNFPPFSFFRVPSRYLTMAVFFMSLMVAFFINFLYKQNKKILQIVLILILLVNVFDVMLFVFKYHLFVSKDIVLATPKLIKKIDEKFTYITIDQPVEWNKILFTKGWRDKEAIDSYLFFKNYLYPNSNLLFRKNVYPVYTTLTLRRQSYLDSLIRSNFAIHNEKLTIVSDAVNLFRLLDIKYLITSFFLNNSDSQEIDSASKGDKTIRLYELKNVDHNKWYIPQKLMKIEYVKDFEDRYLQILDLEKEAFIEGKTNISMNEKNTVTIAEQTVTDTNIQLKGRFEKLTFLVFKKNWYPEWHAYIDKKETPLYKTNLVHIGIDVPKGSHTIKLVYENRSFKQGVSISLITLVIFLFLLKKIDLKFLKRLGD